MHTLLSIFFFACFEFGDHLSFISPVFMTIMGSLCFFGVVFAIVSLSVVNHGSRVDEKINALICKKKGDRDRIKE